MRRWLVVGVLILSISTPWVILQSAAWFGMLVTYSRQAGFAVAVSMTFDGKHPCRLCHLLEQEQAEERHQEKKAATPDQKLELGPPPARLVLIHAPAQHCVMQTQSAHSTRTERPPTPPPRWA